jgi:RNA polymerase sigma-70 factor, ECF subfamily
VKSIYFYNIFVTFVVLMDIISMGKTMINFHEIYNKYANEVCKFVFWLSGNTHDAEDITSETFSKMWLSKNEIKIETVKAYLFTIARNLYLQKIRSKKNFVEIDELVHDTNPGPDRITEAKSELKATLEAMQLLPELDRTILLLHAQHNLTYPEIAQSTGLSVAAIKVKVFRARLKLETYLRGKQV